MSDRLGPLSFGKRDELVFLGREIGEQRNYSDDVAKQIDEEVRAIIDTRLRPGEGGAGLAQGPARGPRREAGRRGDGGRRGVREALLRPPAEGGPPRRRPAPRGRPGPPPAAPPAAAGTPVGQSQPQPGVGPAHHEAQRRRPGDPRRGLRMSRADRRIARRPGAAIAGGPDDRGDHLAGGAISTSTASGGWPPTWTSSGSPPSRRCRRTPPTAAVLPSGWRSELRAAGAENVEVCETGGNPVVYGDWLHAGDAPPSSCTATTTSSRWTRSTSGRPPPFEPFIADGSVVGRGAADDKGQVQLHVAPWRRCSRPAGRAGQREVRLRGRGGVELRAPRRWLEANRERLAADLAVISDTGFFEGNRPAITVGAARASRRSRCT